MKEQLRLENQLCFPLYACARKITGMYTPYLKPLGITYTQYIVFLSLWEEDNLSVSDLCHRLYLDSGTLTPLLKKMEHEGFITRTRSDIDERVVRITLTEKGKQMEDKAAEIPYAIGSCINVTPDEAKALHSLLYKIMKQESD